MSLVIVAVLLAAGPLPSASATQGPPSIAEVQCQVTIDGHAREYRLHRTPDRTETPGWRLSMRERGVSGEIGIALPGAKGPMGAGDTVTFSYRSPVGGVIIDLATGPGDFLDVFVSHGLEVNVNTSLSEDVDRLNTDGRREDARCGARPE
jgi:hypothetical protein